MIAEPPIPFPRIQCYQLAHPQPDRPTDLAWLRGGGIPWTSVLAWSGLASLLLVALFAIADLAELVGSDVVDAVGDDDVHTVGGLVYARAAGTPRVGDAVAVGRHRLVVERMHRRRIVRVRLAFGGDRGDESSVHRAQSVHQGGRREPLIFVQFLREIQHRSRRQADQIHAIEQIECGECQLGSVDQ